MVVACDFALVCIGLVYLIFSYIVIKHGLTYIPICPFYLITGIHCPFCGMTRSLGELLHGDVDSALSYHPCAVILMISWLGFIAFFSFSLMRNIKYFLRHIPKVSNKGLL